MPLPLSGGWGRSGAVGEGVGGAEGRGEQGAGYGGEMPLPLRLAAAAASARGREGRRWTRGRCRGALSGERAGVQVPGGVCIIVVY